jgi:diguanylate cyclase (GGDEF)-like protein
VTDAPHPGAVPNPPEVLASNHPDQASESLRVRQRRLAWLALLSGLGVVLNSVPVPLFYGVHLLLGSLPALLALLLWRTWWAVPMAGLAGLQTVKLWGHPWALVIFIAELSWLWMALRRWNGPASNDTNGRVVIYAIGYWLLIGTPLVLLFYGLVMRIDVANVAVVAVKQSFNGVFNTVLASAFVIPVRWWQADRGQGPGVSLRGVIASVVMLAITVPTILVSLISGQQLEMAVENGALDALQTLNLAISRAPSKDVGTTLMLEHLGEKLAYRRIDADGSLSSSDLPLFKRLDRDFEDGGRANVENRDLAILIPRGKQPNLKKWVNGYWSYSHQYTANNGERGETYLVQVVQPARPLITRMQEQSTALLGGTFLAMLIGTGLSQWLGARVEREFTMAAKPLQNETGELLPLHLSTVIELRQLAELINQRILQVNQLGERLRLANSKLHSSRRDLENLLRSDPLTGCGNRQALMERLGEEVERCTRSGEALSCLCLDVDGFRAINRDQGRRAGDTLLQAMAQAARKRLRSTDHLYRPGQDSFVVLAIGCHTAEARGLADSLRTAIAGVYLTSNGGSDEELRSTVCVGVSALDPSCDDANSLLARAQQALNQARLEGPDQLVMAAERHPGIR